ncbi:MAG TPA: DUF4147 domain-containing protein [Candidatus Paceibacterota bacterium]
MDTAHRIKNFAALARTPVREAALKLVEVALASIDTRAVIRRAVAFISGGLRIAETTFPLTDNGRIFVVGVGKCSLEAALELETILGERITAGVVIDVRCVEVPRRVRFCLGDHPFPSEKNITATGSIIELLSKADQADFIIFIISGGGSALLCQPGDHTCLEEVAVTNTLFHSGATIHEINTVRKHLSLARGGYLAKHAYPARAVALIFSDVPGNDLGVVASGPTVKDISTSEEAKKIIIKYNATGESESIIKHLIETPKEDKYFERVTNLLLLTNETPLRAMAEAAAGLGFTPIIKNSAVTGEARLTGEAIARELHLAPLGSAHLYGGETTVVIRGVGHGGRNQELALGALPQLSAGECLISFASDGVDNGTYAGALCDTITLERAQTVGLDPVALLDRNDSQSFFSAVGDYLDIGYTGANVSDLIIALKSNHV